jgi:hypothetical protein
MPPDPEILHWSEMGEALAFLDTFAAAAARADDAVGAITSRPGGGVAFAFMNLDIPFFNRAIGIGVARPAVESDIDEVVAFYDVAGRQASVAQIAPHATPPDVVGWFEARGYVRSRTWVKMWHSLTQIPDATTDLRIERIGPEWADDFGRLSVAEAYGFPEVVGTAAGVGRPGWDHYVGFDGDVPVSTAATRIEDGVAWLGFGATTPSHRGRGGQSAMFARRLHDARDAGCRFAVVETGKDTTEDPNPSYRNMVRAGFELAYFRHNWVRQAPSAGLIRSAQRECCRSLSPSGSMIEAPIRRARSGGCPDGERTDHPRARLLAGRLGLGRGRRQARRRRLRRHGADAARPGVGRRRSVRDHLRGPRRRDRRGHRGSAGTGRARSPQRHRILGLRGE